MSSFLCYIFNWSFISGPVLIYHSSLSTENSSGLPGRTGGCALTRLKEILDVQGPNKLSKQYTEGEEDGGDGKENTKS